MTEEVKIVPGYKALTNAEILDELCKIKQQRDELLEALKRIADGPWPVEVDNPVAQCRFDEQIARAAIAKAEQ